MTRERIHELYRGFSFDPDIFERTMPPAEYTYRREKVDALFDLRAEEENSIAFAVLADQAVIGNWGCGRSTGKKKAVN